VQNVFLFADSHFTAMSYACIAPLILVFAAGGMAAMRLVWRYNLLYVYDSDFDSKGLFYPRALLHLIIGLYLAEICLIGLFALHLAFGPLAMMVMFFIFTGLVHLSLGDAIAPLLQNLPQTLAMEPDVQREEREAKERARELARARAAEEGDETGANNDYYDTTQTFGEEQDGRGDGDNDDFIDDDDEGIETEDEEEHIVTSERALEGAGSIKATTLRHHRRLRQGRALDRREARSEEAPRPRRAMAASRRVRGLCRAARGPDRAGGEAPTQDRIPARPAETILRVHAARGVGSAADALDPQG